MNTIKIQWWVTLLALSGITCFRAEGSLGDCPRRLLSPDGILEGNQDRPHPVVTLPEQMAARIKIWLADKNRFPIQLAQALKGYGLPAFSFNTDPYSCIESGYSLLADVEKSQFIVGLVEFLNSEPDVEPESNENNEMLYNLFKLCSQIGGLQFRPPLLAMKIREQEGKGLAGREYRSLELSEALSWAQDRSR